MTEVVPAKETLEPAEADHVEVHPWGTGDSPPMPKIDPDRHLVGLREMLQLR